MGLQYEVLTKNYKHTSYSDKVSVNVRKVSEYLRLALRGRFHCVHDGPKAAAARRVRRGVGPQRLPPGRLEAAVRIARVDFRPGARDEELLRNNCSSGV